MIQCVLFASSEPERLVLSLLLGWMTYIATADACLANMDHHIVRVLDSRFLSILKGDVLDGSQDKGRVLVV